MLTMNQGPIRSRPMPLILPSESDVENCFVASKESEMENQQNRDDGNVTKGKGRYTRTKLEHSELFEHVCICCHTSTIKF